MFGTMAQFAIVQAAQAAWGKVSAKESACINEVLKHRGTSVEALIQRGVMPSDPRIADLRSSCPTQTSQLAWQPSGGQIAPYKVAGFVLGSRINFDSSEYREFKCGPSDQFEGYVWCQKVKQEKERRGSFSATYSVLHSRDGRILYVNRYQEPAFFGETEAAEDIQRYTRQVGESARITKMPTRPGFRDGIVATWGGLVLEPLDNESIKILAEGKSPKKGFLIDFIGSFTRSAKEALPIYRISGSAGFVWVASYDQRGRGIMRFAAIDASGVVPSLPTHPSAPVGEAQDRAAWRDLVLLQLERYKTYPPGAVSRGEAGVVQLSFRVDRNGKVLTSSISNSSGYPELDQEVLSLIQRAQPMPPFLPNMPQNSLEISVPIRFNIPRPPSPISPAAPPPEPAISTASIIEKLRATRTLIQDHLSTIRDDGNRKRAEGIVVRLATANSTMSSENLKELEQEAESGRRIIEAETEFKRVSEIANHKLKEIQAELEKVTSDAPLIQELQTAIKATSFAQNGSDLQSLQDALLKLDRLYDGNRTEIRRLQFYSP
jgi:TonB family protein